MNEYGAWQWQENQSSRWQTWPSATLSLKSHMDWPWPLSFSYVLLKYKNIGWYIGANNLG
jgi:hypothetical protein